MKYAIIILAAGGSSRLGSPKQLLPFRNESLISHVVNSAVPVKNSSVIVVTGASHISVQQEVNPHKVHIVQNNDWQSGLASSIKTGIEALKSLPGEFDGCILSVCDQPYINSGVFTSLLNAHEATGKGICASTYKDTVGTPVFFSPEYFDLLLSLKGDEGAKKIVQQHPEDVVLIPFDAGAIDIDTPADFEKLV